MSLTYLPKFILALNISLGLSVIIVPHFLVKELTGDSLSIDIGFFLVLGTWTTAGLFAVQKNARNAVGWLLLGGPTFIAFSAVAEMYALYDATRPGHLPAPSIAVLVSSVSPALFLGSLPLLLALFPSGSPLGGLWRWLPMGIGGATMSLAGGWLLEPQSLEGHANVILEDDPLVPNPIDFTGSELLSGILGAAGFFALFFLALASLFTLILRYRQAKGLERLQIRWVAYGAGWFVSLFVVIAVLGSTASDLPGELDEWLFLASIFPFPVSFAIAIVRYRLYDIDILINRTLVYGPLTALVAGTYAAAVGLAKLAFEAITGAPSDGEIVVATLVAAGVFWMFRVRMIALVDRHFKDPREPIKDLRALQQRVSTQTLFATPASIDKSKLASHVLESCIEALNARAGTLVFSVDGARKTLARGEAQWLPALEVSLTLDGKTLGKLSLSERRDARPHSPRDAAALEETVKNLSALFSS